MVGRNEPCPCGSGRKFKHCHGATIPIAATARSCGTCTACCDGWVAGSVRGHDMRPGMPCHFRGEGRCTIYDERPEDPCRRFVCAWLKPGSPLPVEFRPDRLGVLFIVAKWRGREAWMLRHAGRDPDEALIAWMRNLSLSAAIPFLYEQAGVQLAFGPPEFQRDMLARFGSGSPE